MILIDTSVWIDHLRKSEPQVVKRLDDGHVLMHSSIIGELACGNLNNRNQLLSDWHALPAIPELKNGQVIGLIDKHSLMGKGIGLVDAHILGAVLNYDDCLLWTRDGRLRKIAEHFGVAYVE